MKTSEGVTDHLPEMLSTSTSVSTQEGTFSIPKEMQVVEIMLSSRPQILYVEDHEDTRELVSIILEKNEFEVTTTDTLEDGMRLAQEQQFDLYLLDLWLPDGVGLELARLIREFDRETPIVFFSAAAYEADRVDALQAGAQAYVTKPTIPSELCNVITSLIEVHQLSGASMLTTTH